MADYATVDDIEVLLGYPVGFYTATSIPNRTSVERELDQVTKEIDFYLTAVGVQPTDTNVLARLRNCCQYGVAWKLGYSNFGNNTGVDDSQPDTYRERYENCLKEIKESPELFGKVTGDDVIYASNQVIDGTTTEDEQQSEYIQKDYEV